MPTDVIMPQMGESIFEGTITKWLKKTGDRVEKDEPLFEISTDKVDAEIPAPVAGILSEIKVAEGTTVQINTVVAVVTEEQGTGNRDQGSAGPSPEGAPKVPPSAPQAQMAPPQVVVMPQMGESIFEGTITKWLKKAGDRVEKDEPLFEISTDKVDAEIPAPAAGVLSEIKVPEGATVQINTVVAVIGGSASGSVPSALGEMAVAATTSPAPSGPPQAALAAPQVPQVTGRRLRSSPLVRRIAQENHLDLAQIPATGAEGRITKDDILRYLGTHGPGGTAPSSAPPKVPLTGPKAPLAPPQVPQAGQVVPLSRMRAIIAQRMVESMQIAPHVHVVYKIDMTRIARLRERERAGFEQRHGVKLTYMPFIAAAAVQALTKFPIVNASLLDGSIHYHPNINLGIAVALEWGLIVPVVRQAEQRTFADLARAVADLAARARAKKLMPNEVGGSTFTLTNSGVFGDEFGTPIINQPESAILAIGSLRKEPVVLTDAEGNDAIAIRSMQHFCLGFDHRLIDGADGGKFMSEFKKTLETWDRAIG
jgi:2-oxoglutarate dehydrogenase E2 component (dihydrolipoamide succinyltransferase)